MSDTELKRSNSYRQAVDTPAPARAFGGTRQQSDAGRAPTRQALDAVWSDLFQMSRIR